ncbi:nif11-like leader peptide domain protein [Synechococcus sp. BIOS-E4-1]|uniref:Nif11-like leader peptide family natural product precursor n=1 Tax=Synechococcus sp. BIOS-E4-1 TaxID=1400864 RepID=UPI0016472BAE|nr:Nif11-like leader peptide family natural product precursor [Synechococcus sp. BIOS-E4-1]QNI55350.1 nif11-like leader peptide domain protein [Synechococcus sp. BIOS-E4-1]
MSLEQLKAFLAKIKDDSSLQEKLKATKLPEDVVHIAQGYGYEITANEISKLREDELESLAGGNLQTTVSMAGYVCPSDDTNCPNICP